MKGYGLIGLVLLTILATAATVSAQTITLTPDNGTVGTTVTVVGTGFAANSPVTVYFNVSGNEMIVNNTVSTDDAGNFTATFKVPNVPPGSYEVKANDSAAKSSIALFTVLPIPVEKNLADLGITSLSLNKTFIRENEDIRMDVGVNSSKISSLNVNIVLVNKTSWTSISSQISAGMPVNNSTIWSNSTMNWSVSGSFVDVISGLKADEYYVVAYNVSSLMSYVDMFNVAATITVKPAATPAKLGDFGINEDWSVVNGELNITDVDYGKDLKLSINATKPINVAIVPSSEWDKLYANISTLTKDDVFGKAKWKLENFANNKNETLNISTVSYGITPGTYRAVVFNTTNGYVYAYNNSTLVNVTPVPQLSALAQLGIEQLTINRTQMSCYETLRLVVIRSNNAPVNIAILNETAWNGISKDKNVTNGTILSNATPPYGWNLTSLTTDNVSYISGLIPNKYVVVAYNVTTIGGNEYVVLYNDSLRFEVKLTPRAVSLADLNISKLEVDKATVNYGGSLNLTVNVTGTANFNIAILNETAWNELKQLSGIANETILGKAVWNTTNVNSNISSQINTVNKLLPNNYVVVAYNTTNVGSIKYVNWYNESVRFTVVASTNKVSLSDLGIVTMYLNKTEVAYGGGIKLTVDWNESVTKPVNIAILNVTNWTRVLTASPTNESALASAVWNKTNVNSDLIEEITADFAPDNYVVVAYSEWNGAITNYNDDLRFKVVFEARNVNLTDLVTLADVTPKRVTLGESFTLEVGYKTTVNVAIVDETTWTGIKAEKSILNETLLNNSVWKATNIASDYVRTLSTAGWRAGVYSVVIYNTFSSFGQYVKWYNDSIIITVLAPANFTASFRVNATSGVAPLTVRITVNVTNTGGVSGDYTAVLYVNNTEVANRTITVNASETKQVVFDYTFAQPGTYSVRVNELTPVTITVLAPQPWQRYDSDNDNRISDQELINAIMDWLGNRLSDGDLIKVIMKWLGLI